MPEDPFIPLEIKVTYLEHTLQELNEVVFRQQRTLDALESQVGRLTDQLHQAREALEGRNPPEEKPPHY